MVEKFRVKLSGLPPDIYDRRLVSFVVEGHGCNAGNVIDEAKRRAYQAGYRDVQLISVEEMT